VASLEREGERERERKRERERERERACSMRAGPKRLLPGHAAAGPRQARARTRHDPIRVISESSKYPIRVI
jgi:hypothetical protein